MSAEAKKAILPSGQKIDSDVINAAITKLPKDVAQQVVESIQRASNEAKQQAQEHDIKTLLFNLAITAHQYAAPKYPDDFDSVNWSLGMIDFCESLVRMKTKRPQEMTERLIPSSALRFAMVIWVHHELYGVLEYSEAELDEMLSGSGYTVSKTYDELIDVIEGLAREGSQPGLAGKSRTEIEEIYTTIDRVPLYGGPFFDELESAMRVDLQTIGYRLPELGPNHTYGYAYGYDVEDKYRFPVMQPGDIPN